MFDEQFALGVDVGGTKILMGAVTAAGQLLFEKRYQMCRDDADSIERSVLNALDDMLLSLPARPVGVGIGLVGSVNSELGVWNGAINIPLSRPVPIAERIGEKYDLPVRADNDVHAAALAEARLGGYKDSALSVYINVGTGISAAVFGGGRILHGMGNFAGEMGHMVVEKNDHVCKCGRRGCIEPFVSGGGLVDRMREIVRLHPDCALAGRAERADFVAGEVFEAARGGDPYARELAETSHRMFVSAVANVVNFINPEWVVLGGGALDLGWIRGEFETLVRREALKITGKDLKGIRLSGLDPKKVGLLGAGCVYFEAVATGRNEG